MCIRDSSHYIPPAKGVKQTLRIVREIVASKNDGADQNLSLIHI